MIAAAGARAEFKTTPPRGATLAAPAAAGITPEQAVDEAIARIE
jgi:hypothetical protein